MTMRRDDAIGAIIAHRDHAVIVATYQAAFDLMRIDPNPLNYVSIGAMGIASSHALGLALGLPERRVMVFNGDGSLLMNLASLVTIAAAAPRNLIHFLFENGCYEANGSHPLPNAAAIDFQAIAKGAGLPHALAFDTRGDLQAALPDLLALEGPVFVVLHIVPGAPSPMDYAFIQSPETRAAFRAAIARPPEAG